MRMSQRVAQGVIACAALIVFLCLASSGAETLRTIVGFAAVAIGIPTAVELIRVRAHERNAE